MSPEALGSRAAGCVAGIGVAYAAALSAGFAQVGFAAPIGDPVLAIMEILTLLSAIALMISMAAVYQRAAPERRLFALLALGFTLLFTGITSTVHFVSLTSSRQRRVAEVVWPSTGYAAELLAWDWFLGLALIFAAMVFPGGGAERRLRRALAASGLLALAGTAGPLLGDMRLQRIGILGYAVVLPFAFFLLARFLARQESAGDSHPR